MRCWRATSQGIQFVKQLSKMDDASKQRAEVAAWLKDLDTAEQCYRQMDRPDLAVELQVGVGGVGGCCCYALHAALLRTEWCCISVKWSWVKRGAMMPPPAAIMGNALPGAVHRLCTSILRPVLAQWHTCMHLRHPALGACCSASCCCLQMRLGDWFKVEAMLQDSGGADTELSRAWAHIGEHYADRHKWGKAAQYFTQVGTAS